MFCVNLYMNKVKTMDVRGDECSFLDNPKLEPEVKHQVRGGTCGASLQIPVTPLTCLLREAATSQSVPLPVFQACFLTPKLSSKNPILTPKGKVWPG